MPTYEPLNFDTYESVVIPVTINGKEYKLTEATGAAAVKYRSAVLASTSVGPDGKPRSFKNLAEIEPLLVSLCLFDADNKSVSVEQVKRWPNRIQSKLYQLAKEISDLDEKDDTRDLLGEILSQDDSPISISELETYANTFRDDRFKPLRDWLKPTPEEKAKNDTSDMPDG